MAEIRPSEISDILRNEIKGFEGSVAVRETGRVLSCGDGIARIYGLQNAASGELLEFPHSVYGMVLNLEEDNVGAALFGDPQAIGEGDGLVIHCHAQILQPRRQSSEGFCSLARSVARSVRTHVSTRDNARAQKPSAQNVSGSKPWMRHTRAAMR